MNISFERSTAVKDLLTTKSSHQIKKHYNLKIASETLDMVLNSPHYIYMFKTANNCQKLSKTSILTFPINNQYQNMHLYQSIRIEHTLNPKKSFLDNIFRF